MDQNELSFQIKGNHFNDSCSDFVYHTTLKTTAYLSQPYYAKLSVTRNSSIIKILCIRTSQSLMQVLYKNNEFQEHRKVLIDDERLEKQVITTFTYKTDVYSAANPPTLIIGYRSGLVSYYDTINDRLIRLYNYDPKTRAPYKPSAVTYLAVLPQPNQDEILVMFSDSTAMKFHLNSKSQDDYFVEKIKKFHVKTSFNPATNRYNHTEKSKNNYYYRNGIDTRNPEFSFFYTCAEKNQGQNPKAYYKFNHRTMSDLVVKRHSSFSRTLLNNSNGQEVTVLALTSLDGYLTVFDLNKMKPLLSYKGTFGGINSVSFSESCELLALGGQDDCITVLDLNTFKTLRCEGHKSFVSRCIFHPIHTSKQTEKEPKEQSTRTSSLIEESRTEENSQIEEEYVRIIGCGLDSTLSFWEFPKNIFGNKNWLQREEGKPISLKVHDMPPATLIKPIHMELEQDAIGSIELCGDMLIQCLYDGGVCTNLIKDLDPSRKNDDGSPKDGQTTKRTGGGDTHRKLISMSTMDVKNP